MVYKVLSGNNRYSSSFEDYLPCTGGLSRWEKPQWHSVEWPDKRGTEAMAVGGEKRHRRGKREGGEESASKHQIDD